MFIAFLGWHGTEINQDQFVETIGQDFECWNLKKVTLEEFVLRIKEKIPPINSNILRNYITTSEPSFGTDERQFGQCTWGLLLPDPAIQGNSYGEIINAINLFSPSFLRPAFYVTDFGIHRVENLPNASWILQQDKSELFKSTNFISFYNAILPLAKYFRWLRDDVLLWNDEDWRLFMAASFYKDLAEYENSKQIYTWQRESADMATLLETLFTAGEGDKEEIGYRLRKRAFTLIGWKFPTIEDDIKILYKDRSEFVHGSYFMKIIRGMRRNSGGDPAMPPSPDFDKLLKMKECIRFILVAYLVLHANKTTDATGDFASYPNVQAVLEESILNVELRNKVMGITKPVFDLMPT